MKNLYFSLLPDAEKAKYKTEKQWFKLGFVPVSQDAGTIMYSNRFCTGKYRYLTSEEVRKATNEEMTPYHEEQRRKRRSRYLQSKKEREQAIRYGELLSLCDQQRQLDEENYRGTIPTLTVSIDIETTGLDFNQDEILQVSILDIDTGEVAGQLCETVLHRRLARSAASKPHHKRNGLQCSLYLRAFAPIKSGVGAGKNHCRLQLHRV